MNVLTIDVEDWYHCLEPDPAKWSGYEDRIVGSTQQVLAILKEAGVTATFFVLGHVAETHPELVRKIDDEGHEVASHGCEHRFIYRQTPEQFEADLSRSVSLLSEITGKPVRGYRAPYFSITKESLWALEILEKLEFRYDSSIFPVVNHRYGIPSAPRLPYQTDEGLTELPVSTYPLGRLNVPCGGGVYFRLFPYRLTRRLFRRMSKRNETIVFYLHPWELDAGQPRIPMRATLKIRHYWGLHKTAGKLARLLREFPFGSVREALNL